MVTGTSISQHWHQTCAIFKAIADNCNLVSLKNVSLVRQRVPTKVVSGVVTKSGKIRIRLGTRYLHHDIMTKQQNSELMNSLRMRPIKMIML